MHAPVLSFPDIRDPIFEIRNCCRIGFRRSSLRHELHKKRTMPTSGRSPQKLRLEIAHLAARMIAEDGIADYRAAKRKAALRLGVRPDRFMPANHEIEQALVEYQRLFQGDVQPAVLIELRRTAVEAMTFLRSFRPKLTGPVLAGTATRHSEIVLHLQCGAPEEIGLFLAEHGMPFRHTTRTIRTIDNGSVELPAFRFLAGQTGVILVAFDERRRHLVPLSPIDGRTMQRAALHEVENLLARTG
jgi:hypothetical protein